MGNTIFNIRKTFNFGFFIILCLTVFFPFNTLSQTGTLQFTEEEKAWISSHPVINVGNERFWPPMDFVKDGEPMGYSIDLMNLIAQALGIEINYINGLSWSELLDALNNGTIDVLPAISKTDEREAYIKFSKSYIKLPYVKVINGALPNSEDSKLENKTIAVFKGSNVESALINEYQNINLIYLNTVVEALRKVSTGEVDIFIENLAVIMYYLNESYVPNLKLNSDNLTFLNSPDVFIGVLKKNEILGNLIDKGLEAVSKEDISLLKNKWLPIETSKPEILLTAEEKQWISQQDPIKVANSIDWAPFNFSENGTPKGFSIELLQLVGEKTGLAFNFIGGNTWSEILEKFKLGELEILPSVYFTESRKEFISFTESYASNPSVIVVNAQNSDIKAIEDLLLKKVAVITNFAAAEILDSRYPNIEQIYVKNVGEGLKEVSLGNVDAFIASIGPISYLIDKNFIPNVKIIGNINIKRTEEIQLLFGVPKDNIILRDILQKGLDAVTREEKNEIRQKWLPVSITLDQKEEAFDSSVLWKTVVGVIILFVIFFFSFKWLFKRVIKEKIALEFGSRKFRIKTNFYLSVLTIVIAGLGWLGIIYIETEFSNNIKLQLENDLASANGKLDFWLNQKKAYLKAIGQNQKLVDLSNDLVGNSTSYSKEQYNGLNNTLAQFFEEQNYQASYLINRQGINIGSVDIKLVGELNNIARYRPDLIKQAFKGEVIFIPPLLTENTNFEIVEEDDASPMYFVIPIENNENQVISALIQKIDPSRGFSEILQLSHVGETGESYIFSREGNMLSKSRFEKNLNLLFNSSGVPNIEIRDPGGNLTKGFISVGSIDQDPLTLMAQSAIAGNSGVNVDGYNDYRGVPVMGAWMWIEELELGLATEIDVSEALKLFYFIRLSAIVVFGFTLVLIIGSILFTLTLGEKANTALIKAKDELEERVKLRTVELNNEKVFLNSLINAIPDVIFYKDINFRFLGVNKAFEMQIGFKKEEIMGKTVSQFIPEEQLSKHFEKTDKLIIEKLEPISMEFEYVDPDGNKIVYDSKKSPFFSEAGELLGLIGVSRDITDRKKAEEEILKRTQELNDERVLLNTLINNIPDHIFYKDINYKYLGANESFLKVFDKKINEIIGKSDFELLPLKEAEAFSKVNKKVLKTLKTITTEHERIDIHGNSIIQETRKTPFFNKKGDLIGLIGISRDITERKKLEEIILKAKERMEDELNVAKDIQMSMLPLTFPAFPNREEIDIYAELIPAREVGGDFYDFYFLDKNHICFVMGDVSGKGVPAALMMAVTKTLLKSRAGNDKSTASILTHVNNEIAKENEACMFITVFMAILNTNTGELVYSNAGHNPSYVISKETKEITKLRDLHGPVVGAMEDITYQETQLFLKTNDIVLAYTDGVTESQNIKEELYSDARFVELLKKGEYNSSKALTKLIIESVKEFEGDADQFDDITVLALEYCQNPKKVSSINSSIKIKNDLKEIANAIEWFEAFGLKNKMAFVIIQKFNIAFDELLNNIISYSYNDEDEHFINIDIELKDERLIITISDDGIPFNPFIIGPPDTTLSVEERYIGGLGIHIVKNLMDEYDYKRHVNNNIITLIKYNINT